MSKYKKKVKKQPITVEYQGDLFEDILLENYWDYMKTKLSSEQISACLRVRNRAAFIAYCEDNDIIPFMPMNTDKWLAGEPEKRA